MNIIDSHAHLSDPELIGQADEILARAKAASVQKIVNICTGEMSLAKGLELAKRAKGMVFNAAATPPHTVETEGESFFPFVEEAARGGDLIAIGETGLDYYYQHSPRETQIKFLIRYFSLAIETNLPIIIHCRDAFLDLFTLADEHYKGRPLLLHCFTGTNEEAKEAVKRGWMISISGIATFKKSEGLREAIRSIPLENLFVETDAPYLAPQSKRGKQNEPSFIVETLETMARVKGVSLEEIAAATTENASHFFSFPKDI